MYLPLSLEFGDAHMHRSSSLNHVQEAMNAAATPPPQTSAARHSVGGSGGGRVSFALPLDGGGAALGDAVGFNTGPGAGGGTSPGVGTGPRWGRCGASSTPA